MPRKDAIYMGELTDTAYYILVSLLDEKHGYLIMKTVEELTNGQMIIGPASLYTTLKKLLNADLIKSKESDSENKKVYEITEYGIVMLKNEVLRKRKMVDHAELLLSQREETSDEE